MHVFLEMPNHADPAYCARIMYAFRLFCAIYGHVPIVEPACGPAPDVVLSYRRSSQQTGRSKRPAVFLSRGYNARHFRKPAPAPHRYAHESIDTVVHYEPIGADAPDWLGEIFEWVSCADEYSVTDRDTAGRPRYSATYMGRHGLNAGVPYAAVAMRCLQREICRVVPRATEGPDSPRDGAHFVIPSHDVDYFPAGRFRAANRLIRNAAMSLLMAKQPALGLRQLSMAAKAVTWDGYDPLDRISALVDEELRRGISASFNFLVRHGHRLDAHYTLGHSAVEETIRWLESKGMEVGIHTSYLCLDTPNGLALELARFHKRGLFPRGGRQHWLRYTMDRLIPAVERAGLAYDTSIGWSERAGFRAGACFTFPPYNFAQERASTFLEFPLVMMDQALQMRWNARERMFEEASGLLAASRRLGWGGISVLWHPAAFGEGWLPSVVGDIFWSLADRRAEWGDVWTKARDFHELARQRFVDVGLLPACAPSPTTEIDIEEYIGAMDELNGENESRSLPDCRMAL